MDHLRRPSFIITSWMDVFGMNLFEVKRGKERIPWQDSTWTPWGGYTTTDSNGSLQSCHFQIRNLRCHTPQKRVTSPVYMHEQEYAGHDSPPIQLRYFLLDETFIKWQYNARNCIVQISWPRICHPARSVVLWCDCTHEIRAGDGKWELAAHGEMSVWQYMSSCSWIYALWWFCQY